MTRCCLGQYVPSRAILLRGEGSLWIRLTPIRLMRLLVCPIVTLQG